MSRLEVFRPTLSDNAAVREVSCAMGQVAVYSEASEAAAINEDHCGAFIVASGAIILAVADGVGGHALGAEASRAALDAIEEALSGDAPPSDPSLRGLILDAFEVAQKRVRALGAGAATTLAVGQFAHGFVRTYHAGDSGICVMGRGGRLKLRTVPHSPSGYAVEAGLLGENEALLDAERHIVSNVIGNAELRVEVGWAFPLARNDTVLLASDGLFDNLSLEEIVAIARKGPLPEAAQRLADKARKRMEDPSPGEPSKPDDLTFVLYRAQRRRA